MIATPVYRLMWQMGARTMSSKVPSKQASIQMARRLLGRTEVASKMLARRPKHIPLLKKESVSAALQEKYYFFINYLVTVPVGFKLQWSTHGEGRGH